MGRTETKPKYETPQVPDGVRVLSAEEAWDVFDSNARDLLGISGEEFIREYEAGRISNEPESYAVTKMLMMLPLVGLNTR